MSQYFKVHPENPQIHLLRQAAATLIAGGVIVYPTDSCYALACCVGEKKAMERIKRIRALDEDHQFSLVCRDLSELSTYARVSNSVYRILRTHTPGPYTFLLQATREVPRRLQHPNRKTIGIRVPANLIALKLLEVLDQPLLSTTLILPSSEYPLIEPQAIRELLGKQIDCIIDGGYCGLEPTTVVDLSENIPKIIRYGKGNPSPFLTYT